MPRGFFKNEDTQFQRLENRNKVRTTPSCGICKLNQSCESPKMSVTGEGQCGILIVGEAPGQTEDEVGRQFVGKAGQRLQNTLALFDIEMERDCWLINSINCRPPKNRTPTTAEVEYCRPIPMKAINDLKPNLIILTGGTAVASIIGHRWKKNLKGIGRWRGWTIPDRDLEAWVCPVFHPSYVERMDHDPVVQKIFEDDLYDAIALATVPVPKFKDEKQFVQIMKSETEIIAYLKDLVRRKPKTAFDYETTGLKPHAQVQEIVSMAISEHREHAVSFPMTRKINNAVRDYLVTDMPKVAANMKFEESWSREKLGVEVAGWWFDTLLGARLIDNRADISSLKFQVYINFGLVDYDSHIESFKKSAEKGAHAVNRIKQLKIDDLLMYGGLDALFERWLGEVQEREIDNATEISIPGH